MVWRLEYWYGWIGWDGHKFWLDRNDGHWNRHGLVVFVSVSVDTQLLRYLLADSHWRLLVDFMANFIWHIPADLVWLLCTFLVRNVSADFSRNIVTDLGRDVLTDGICSSDT